LNTVITIQEAVPPGVLVAAAISGRATGAGSLERMRRRGYLLLPLASALAVAAVAAFAAVLTMPHHDSTDAAGQQQLDTGGFTFHYPATWHKIKAGDHKHPAEAAVPLVFLASKPMRGNCARTSDGLACGNWPPGRLSDGGLVVSVANHYGRAEPLRGTVAGRPASINRGSPSVECVNIGGGYELVAQLVAVPAPASGQEDMLVQVDACLAGAASDHDQALSAIDRMLATATFH
jgi:hypothetical protein